METSKKCENCKYYQNGICIVPIWADGKFYSGQVTKPEKSCALFEQSDNLMAVVEEGAAA